MCSRMMISRHDLYMIYALFKYHGVHDVTVCKSSEQPYADRSAIECAFQALSGNLNYAKPLVTWRLSR